MTNLLEETTKFLQRYNKTFADIIAICIDDCQITKENFIRCANVQYNSGYGTPEVYTDLKLVGKDFWLERAEYDGSEWWEYKSMPNYQEFPIKEINSLIYSNY